VGLTRLPACLPPQHNFLGGYAFIGAKREGSRGVRMSAVRGNTEQHVPCHNCQVCMGGGEVTEPDGQAPGSCILMRGPNRKAREVLPVDEARGEGTGATEQLIKNRIYRRLGAAHLGG
jgi:hypothetical protein